MTALSASLGTVVAAPSATAERIQGVKYYVDCVSGDDAAPGTSPDDAWRSLARVNQVTFGPGDTIAFRRGTTCEGVLQPKGSGTSWAPITINAYGDGSRPKIVAPGARAAVYLYNVEGWEIREIEITNPGPVDGTARVGIYVVLEDYGTGHYYNIVDVYVHDVPGCDCLDPKLENSGGILFEAKGSAVPTTFDDIRVVNSTVSGVDNIGIGTLSSWSKRELYPGGTNHFMPMTNVRFARNELSNLGGDGILVMNGVDSVTTDNKVDGFGLRAIQSHAAILAYNSDRALMQFNEITGGAVSPPSFSLSVDAATQDLLYQYNYSHDNNGPFILFCAPEGTYADGAIVRYNISANDHDTAIGDFEIPVVAAGCVNSITNSHFYNNVVYSPTATNIVGVFPHTSIRFTNNIFSGRPEGSNIDDPVGIYDHNLYHNIASVPINDANAVVGDPLFVGPYAPGPDGFRLSCGSPAVNAGVEIRGAQRDFFGNWVGGDSTPNIGADDGWCS